MKNKMYNRKQSEDKENAADKMLKEKMNKDFNKKNPDPADPNETWANQKIKHIENAKNSQASLNIAPLTKNYITY